MGYFPMCIDLCGKTVFLVGNGPQIRDKAEKLHPFSPELVFMDDLMAEDLNMRPALVVVGDMERSSAERISGLCISQNIAVNVVDIPELCTFYFPSLISREYLTVSISTGGHNPAAAAFLRQRIEENIPDRIGEILLWLDDHRKELQEAGILKEVIALAFQKNRILSEEEYSKKQHLP